MIERPDDATPEPDPREEGRSEDEGAPSGKEGSTETDSELPDDQQAMQPDSS